MTELIEKAIALILAPFLFIGTMISEAVSPQPMGKTGDVTKTFSDGSYIEDAGMAEYYHHIPGGIRVYYQGLQWTAVMFPEDMSDVPCAINDNGVSSVCHLESYSFSENGRYFAYHALMIDENSLFESARTIKINDSDTTVGDEYFGVIDTKKKEEKLFDDYSSLERYREENKIPLGARYHPSPFGSEPEEETLLGGGYSLVTCPYELEAIRFDGENVYFGNVDKVTTKEGEISFTLTVPRGKYYYYAPASENQNSGITLRDEDDISFWDSLFKRDYLYKGKITIDLNG